MVWFKEEIPRCSFVTWTAVLKRYMAFRPSSLDSVAALCQQIHGPHAQRATVILKLLSQIIVYNLWRERNARIFRDLSITQEAFFRIIDRAIRDRLLAPSLVSSSFPSLLQLYFWFLSPFS
ncbi:hypothetical protein N665_0324s0019 [Sinapis alba]|nr:hypothetical protein N665_0324s0019 [Sinapis alba]